MNALIEGLLLFAGICVVGLVVASLISSTAGSHIPGWILKWLSFSSIICTWDALFVLNRPGSFDSPLWFPYKNYVVVDRLYGDVENPWVWTQSCLNVVEVVFNLVALFSKRPKFARSMASFRR